MVPLAERKIVFDSDEAFVAALQSHLGSALQTVASREDGGYEMLYTREDVTGRFTPADFNRIHGESLLADEPREDAENVFRAGALNFALYTFDTAVVLQFPGESGALFVAFDNDDVPLLPIVEVCTEWMQTRA
ncbi:hypothetical protein SAMN05421858_1529 [Haladaptatus litoreus]|uniref:Uncharacterized protein n=1 Tax=Haladaptatus litoreus TaxID=553468 RepID=A0A1N6YE72_9EURY|nr:hypothetical protein SAMN05421858_1529 [Haladaptatus litoreus]